MEGFARRFRSRIVENWLLIASTIMSSMLVSVQVWWTHPNPHLEHALDAVVIIKTPSGSGSGFFISKDGCALTAAHVVIDALAKKQRIVVVTRGTARMVPGEVVALNQFADLAMICTPVEAPAWLRIADTEGVKSGEPVYALGHPAGGRTWNVTEGVVSRTGYKMHNIGGKIWIPRYDIWTSAFISWGNSGGPALNQWGDVIGMVVEWDGTEIGRPNNSNILVPGTDLRRFIRSVWGKY